MRRICIPGNPVRLWDEAPAFADVVQEEDGSFRKREVGISSIPVGPIVVPGKDRWRSAALVRLTGEFKSPAGTHCRKALRASRRLIADSEMVRFHLRQPSFHSGKVELAHHDGLISRSGKVRFRVPLPFCTWGVGLLAVVTSLAMRTFSGVGIPDPPPVCLDSGDGLATVWKAVNVGSRPRPCT